MGPKGITNEILLAIVLDRLEAFQQSKFSCAENAGAIQHLNKAMEALHSRTKDRMARGVEGKLEV